MKFTFFTVVIAVLSSGLPEVQAITVKETEVLDLTQANSSSKSHLEGKINGVLVHTIDPNQIQQ